MDLILRGATIVTDGLEINADLGISQGKIAQIGAALSSGPETVVLDLEGRYLFPGAVEFLSEIDDFASATPEETAPWISGHAALGGVTTIVAPAHIPQGRPIREWAEALSCAVAPYSFVDFGFHLAINHWDEILRRTIRAISSAGISSIWLDPIPLARSNQCGFESLLWHISRELADSALILAPMWDASLADILSKGADRAERSASASSQIDTQPDNETLALPEHFPAWAEIAAIERTATMARATGARILLRSVSGSQALNIYQQRRESGVRLLVAAGLGHLVARMDTATDGPSMAGASPCWPPVRGKADQGLLWACLDEGIIPVVTASCGFPGSLTGFVRPNGARHPAENMALIWSLLYTEGIARNRLSLAGMVQALSGDAAKLAGLYPAKGSLLIGSDADIVVFNPEMSWSVEAPAPESAEGESPAPPQPSAFGGWILQGLVEKVFLRGNLLVDQGQMTSEPGMGRYVERRMQMR